MTAVPQLPEAGRAFLVRTYSRLGTGSNALRGASGQSLEALDGVDIVEPLGLGERAAEV